MDFNRLQSTGIQQFLAKTELMIAEEKAEFGLLKQAFRAVFGRWPKGVDGQQKAPVRND